MSLEKISAAEALSTLGNFSDVIDARSEGEFAEDHLPGAINWPSLHDDERKIVGTQYKRSTRLRRKSWVRHWSPKTLRPTLNAM